MNIELQNAAIDIRAQLLSAEDAATRSAEETALLIATVLKARRELGKSINTGAREVNRAEQALTRSLGSMRSLHMLHGGLHVLADGEGVETWYGPSESVPNKPGGHLRQVA